MTQALKRQVQEPAISTHHRTLLFKKFQSRIQHNPALDRTLVSFQSNKLTPFYSWFKYREGFSQRLITYLLGRLWLRPPGILLDPFAGAGTALFAARAHGWKTTGIEVLPVGVYAMHNHLIASRTDAAAFEATLNHIIRMNFAQHYNDRHALQHIPITRGAFPADTERELVGYVACCHELISDNDMRALFLGAAFSILEEISYTRKDGQYLRWDYRSGRSQGKILFDKGIIRSFRESIEQKLSAMLADLKGKPIQVGLFGETDVTGRAPLAPDPEFRHGSCLELMPLMETESVDFILTSPPYANRYDYTRTYALELVYLGHSQDDVKRLRQCMLSCTVENKDKRESLRHFYESLGRESDFEFVDQTFHRQAALQEALHILDRYRQEGKLNNDNIARLVRNYFYEMSFVVFEMSRLLRAGGAVVMVNDNVRYAGEEMPVDLILSDMAETFGLTTRHIWTLARGKGNSSQQMGVHGRSELRKCVYVWEKRSGDGDYGKR
jgi:hypothetical protein